MYADSISPYINGDYCNYILEGDIQLLPSSTFGISNDSFIIKPAGTDEREEIDVWLDGGLQIVFNPNNTGWLPLSGGYIQYYTIVIKKLLEGGYQSVFYEETFNYYPGTVGDASGINYKFRTLIEYGKQILFTEDGTYTVQITAQDNLGNSETKEQEIILENLIPIYPTLASKYLPYQGMNIQPGNNLFYDGALN